MKQAAVYGVAQSRTRLKWLSSSSSSKLKIHLAIVPWFICSPVFVKWILQLWFALLRAISRQNKECHDVITYIQDGKTLHAGWQKPTRRMAKTYTQDGKNLHVGWQKPTCRMAKTYILLLLLLLLSRFSHVWLCDPVDGSPLFPGQSTGVGCHCLLPKPTYRMAKKKT